MFYNFVNETQALNTNILRFLALPPELAQVPWGGKLTIDIPGYPQTTCKNYIHFKYYPANSYNFIILTGLLVKEENKVL